MAEVVIYTKEMCPYCMRAKTLLAQKGVTYQEVDLSCHTDRLEEMIQRSGRRSVPQIFIDGESIGGYDDMSALDATGELDKRLGL